MFTQTGNIPKIGFSIYNFELKLINSVVIAAFCWPLGRYEANILNFRFIRWTLFRFEEDNGWLCSISVSCSWSSFVLRVHSFSDSTFGCSSFSWENFSTTCQSSSSARSGNGEIRRGVSNAVAKKCGSKSKFSSSRWVSKYDCMSGIPNSLKIVSNIVKYFT